MSVPSFKILRENDRVVFDALRAAAKEAGCEPPAINVHSLTGESIKAEAIEPILALDTIAISRFDTTIGNVVVAIIRELRNEQKPSYPPSFDRIEVSSGKGDPVDRARIIASLRKHFTPLDKHSYRDAIDQATRTVLESRERDINDLSNLTRDLIRQLAEHTRNQETQFQSRVQSLETAAEQQRKDIESLAASRAAEMDAEQVRREERAREVEAKLLEREAEIENLRSESNRRELRLKMHKKLDEWAGDFKLTKGTYEKAKYVAGVFGVLFFVFVIFSGIAFYNFAAHENDWRYALPLSATWLALAVTAVFAARWANQLYRSHADEEFRLKRMQLDIERASWVYEMAREWEHDSNGQPMPQFLIDRLSRELFQNPNAEPVATSAGDVLISKGLFGRWKLVRIHKGDAGLEFHSGDDDDRKHKSKRDDDEEE